VLLAAWAEVPPLQPRGYVSDFAAVVSAGAAARAERLAGEVERKTGAQIAIVLVRELGGEPIENYANTLARRWGIGKKDNRGVLLLVAVDDRRNRLEIGYGLEPILPDGKVGGILRSLRPLLRQGDFDAAVTLAAQELAGVIAADAGVVLESDGARPPSRPTRRVSGEVAWWMILGAAGLIWLLFKMGLHPLFLLGSLGGGGSSGRGGGGGNWDGGGFSGFGGGDFGGGGASSDW